MNFDFIKRRLKHPSWLKRRSRTNSYWGRRGERAAARFLKRHNHRIIARNYRCPTGEIDLISVDGDTLVFVEVKTRAGKREVDPREVVGPQKWARIERNARYFLARRAANECPCRFDVVTIAWPARGGPVIEHFVDAYQPRRA